MVKMEIDGTMLIDKILGIVGRIRGEMISGIEKDADGESG